MEVIREYLIYKDVPIKICMKQLKPIEHYEVVRLILASSSKHVSVCSHESTNSYIEGLLKKLNINFYHCSHVEDSKLVFSSPEDGVGGGATSSVV